MARWTVIKIRGKRQGAPAEKLRTSKKRKVATLCEPKDAANGWESSVAAHAQAVRKRRRHRREASSLEQLPTEILQDIFELSGNTDLVFVSSSLRSKLSSSHMQMRLFARALQPVLGDRASTEIISEEDLGLARRLLSSRFVDWDFFIAWLNEAPKLKVVDANAPEDSRSSVGDPEERWLAMSPSRRLQPPSKIFTAPFTESKIRFLRLFLRSRNHLDTSDRDQAQLLYEGAVQAITEGSETAVDLLCRHGLAPDTELLQQAITIHGCNRDIVQALLSHSQSRLDNLARDLPSDREHLRGAIDPLDPSIWSWAEQQSAAGNDDGEWVLAQLRDLR